MQPTELIALKVPAHQNLKLLGQKITFFFSKRRINNEITREGERELMSNFTPNGYS